MRHSFSTARWTRILTGGRPTAPTVVDRWAPILESVWASRLDALDARCAAIDPIGRCAATPRPEVRHGR